MGPRVGAVAPGPAPGGRQGAGMALPDGGGGRPRSTGLNSGLWLLLGQVISPLGHQSPRGHQRWRESCLPAGLRRLLLILRGPGYLISGLIVPKQTVTPL